MDVAGTYSTGSPSNIGTYNLTSFLKFRMSEKKFLNEKNQNQWTEANLVISCLLHLPRPNENGLSHHFHPHQLILSYLRTFRSQFTYRYAWCCQAFRSTVFSSICQFSVSIAVSCQAYPSHSRCHHCRRRPPLFHSVHPGFNLIQVNKSFLLSLPNA